MVKWSMDLWALEKACYHMGLQKLVNIQIQPDDHEHLGSFYLGTHTWNDEKDRHEIIISNDVEIEDIDKIIIHELTHALQLERDFKLDHERYAGVYEEWLWDHGLIHADGSSTVERDSNDYQDWENTYFLHPMEAEALENETRLGWLCPLVVALES